MKATIHLILSLLFVFLAGCQQQQENKKQEQEPLSREYELLNKKVSAMKQSLNALDTALKDLSVMEQIMEEPDSTKRALRSREQDMVRIYKPETNPVIDTASEGADYVKLRSKLVLDETRQKVQEAQQQIETHLKLRQSSEAPDPDQELSKNMDNQVSSIRNLITSLEQKADSLQHQLNAVDHLEE